MEEKPVPSSSREETGRRASGRKGCCGIAGYKTTGNGTKEFPIPVKPKSDSYPRPGVLYRLRSGSSLGGRIARGAFSSGPAHFYWKINDNGKKSFKLVGNECFLSWCGVLAQVIPEPKVYLVVPFYSLGERCLRAGLYSKEKEADFMGALAEISGKMFLCRANIRPENE